MASSAPPVQPISASPQPATIAGSQPPANPEINAPAREERLFLLLSIFIGIISGLLVVSFRMAIEWLSVLLLGSAPAPAPASPHHRPRRSPESSSPSSPASSFPQVRGSGVNQTKAALYIHNGYISFRTVIGKFLLSALAIGSGHSLGPEDPSLQIGAGVASLISRRVGLSREKLRIFAPVGAAAGLAAAFNAPISAILFVIEEVIGQWSAGVLGSIVLAAVSSVVVARWFWGAEPMFRIPSVTLRDPRELLAYAVLGLVGGVASLLFAKALGYLRPRLRRQPAMVADAAARARRPPRRLHRLLRPSAGHGRRLRRHRSGHARASSPGRSCSLLAVFKIVATTLSFSSGTPGGMFAPTLFIGAMLGAAVGAFEKIFFPHLTGSIGSYALVGMGVLFAAFLRAPLTSVFMVLEVSGNYSIILPVILANTIAYLISRSLQPVPIFELFTHQDGLYLPSMEEQREETEPPLRRRARARHRSRPAGRPDPLCSAQTAFAAKSSKTPTATAVLIQCRDSAWYAATPPRTRRHLRQVHVRANPTRPPSTRSKIVSAPSARRSSSPISPSPAPCPTSAAGPSSPSPTAPSAARSKASSRSTMSSSATSGNERTPDWVDSDLVKSGTHRQKKWWGLDKRAAPSKPLRAPPYLSEPRLDPLKPTYSRRIEILYFQQLDV